MKPHFKRLWISAWAAGAGFLACSHAQPTGQAPNVHETFQSLQGLRLPQGRLKVSVDRVSAGSLKETWGRRLGILLCEKSQDLEGGVTRENEFVLVIDPKVPKATDQKALEVDIRSLASEEKYLKQVKGGTDFASLDCELTLGYRSWKNTKERSNLKWSDLQTQSIKLGSIVDGAVHTFELKDSESQAGVQIDVRFVPEGGQ